MTAPQQPAAAQPQQGAYRVDPKTFKIDGQALPYDFPRCERIVTKKPFPMELPPDTPAEVRKQIEAAPLVWSVGNPHPIIPEIIVMRMYVVPGVGVEVYCIDAPPKPLQGGMRYTLPWHMIEMTEEALDLNALGNEILSIEKEQAGDDDPDDPEPPAATTTNGAS